MKTILVIDDSATLRQLLVVALKKRGDRVVEAGDGREALKVLSAESVHLIITDLDMPVMDGVELVRRVRALPTCASIPIYILTADLQSKAAMAGKAAGATGWIAKPFDLRRLYAVVDRILGPAIPRRTHRIDPLKAFRLEADELLLRIGKIAGELELYPGSAAGIEQMFRVFHTLHGTGAMFGFTSLAEFARHFEVALRNAKDVTHTVEKPLLALICAARDQLRILIEDPKATSAEPECARIIAALEDISHGAATSPLPQLPHAHHPDR